MWLLGRSGIEVTNRKCWVHTYCNRNGELCSSVVARELDSESVRLYTARHSTVIIFCPALNNKHLTSHTNGMFPNTLDVLNICLPTRAGTNQYSALKSLGDICLLSGHV
jgi:hypothetical protein